MTALKSIHVSVSNQSMSTFNPPCWTLSDDLHSVWVHGEHSYDIWRHVSCLVSGTWLPGAEQRPQWHGLHHAHTHTQCTIHAQNTCNTCATHVQHMCNTCTTSLYKICSFGPLLWDNDLCPLIPGTMTIALSSLKTPIPSVTLKTLWRPTVHCFYNTYDPNAFTIVSTLPPIHHLKHSSYARACNCYGNKPQRDAMPLRHTLNIEASKPKMEHGVIIVEWSGVDWIWLHSQCVIEVVTRLQTPRAGFRRTIQPTK